MCSGTSGGCSTGSSPQGGRDHRRVVGMEGARDNRLQPSTPDVEIAFILMFQSLGERFVPIRWRRPGGDENAENAALQAMNQDHALMRTTRRRGGRPLSGSIPSRHRRSCTLISGRWRHWRSSSSAHARRSPVTTRRNCSTRRNPKPRHGWPNSFASLRKGPLVSHGGQW